MPARSAAAANADVIRGVIERGILAAYSTVTVFARFRG
jgi:hypothetical protein